MISRAKENPGDSYAIFPGRFRPIASGSTSRRRGTANQPIVQNHIGLDRGKTSGIEHLAGDNTLDSYRHLVLNPFIELFGHPVLLPLGFLECRA